MLIPYDLSILLYFNIHKGKITCVQKYIFYLKVSSGIGTQVLNFQENILSSRVKQLGKSTITQADISPYLRGYVFY